MNNALINLYPPENVPILTDIPSPGCSSSIFGLPSFFCEGSEALCHRLVM